jgi:2-keto-3-deoxy-L-rhamnonate aldolase RhmA
VADLSRAAILAPLDAGAAGIIAPAIETVAQVRELVRLSRCPPLGDRSAAHYTRAFRYTRGFQPSSFIEHDEDIVTGVILETPAGIRAAPEILQMTDIDFVCPGKIDLSVRYEPHGVVKDVEAQLLELGAQARANGKSIGAAVANAAEVKRYAASGYNIFFTAAYPLIMRAAVGFAELVRSGLGTDRG